jgi:hypothetical protein
MSEHKTDAPVESAINPEIASAGIISTSKSSPIARPMSTDDTALLTTIRSNIERIEALAVHEYSLIGNRMVWFAISQSFLFGAYATIATDSVRLAAIFGAPGAVTYGALTGKLLLVVVPFVGLLFALAAAISVRAASDVLAVLDPSRGRMLHQMNDILIRNGFEPIPVIGDANQRFSFNSRLGTTIRRGNLPQVLLPYSMIAIWAVTVLIRVPWIQILQALTSP